MANEEKETLYTYEVPSKDRVYSEAAELVEAVKKYLAHGKLDVTLGDLECNAVLLGELLVRVDRERVYFSIFENNTQIDELKTAALIAHGLIHLQPFSVKKKTASPIRINEYLAIFFLMSTAWEVTQRRNRPFSISRDYIDKLKCAFRYNGLSKEAMMLVAESLCV